MEGRYNYNQDADVLFATNDKEEAIEAAKDFGQGTVVVFVSKDGNKERIFTASYKTELGLLE
jgi:3'-phosphoadenosine 5'-phosphosulfate sulfotransferase